MGKEPGTGLGPFCSLVSGQGSGLSYFYLPDVVFGWSVSISSSVPSLASSSVSKDTRGNRAAVLVYTNIHALKKT